MTKVTLITEKKCSHNQTSLKALSLNNLHPQFQFFPLSFTTSPNLLKIMRLQQAPDIWAASPLDTFILAALLEEKEREKIH